MFQRRMAWLKLGGTLALVTMILSIADAAPPTKFVWDRNTEADLDHYEMYVCSSSATCVPGTGPTDRLGADVPQSPSGTQPELLIPDGMAGRAAVLAVDSLGNKSGLSNIVFFDRQGPAAPTGLVPQ